MTDYWVSNERYYCKECGSWMDAKPTSVRKHEQGFRHKGNVDRLLKKLKREQILANKEAKKHNAEFAAIERAAKKQYMKDCANGLATMTPQQLYSATHNSSTQMHPQSRRKDRDRALLAASGARELFYYLNKEGVAHGPYTAHQMCVWHHFGFFVGALRVRRREQAEFIHLRDMEDPFGYAAFKQNFETDTHFKNRVVQSIDLADERTLPPAIDIPAKLKSEFYKLYPPKKDTAAPTQSRVSRPIAPAHANAAVNSATDRAEQRKLFIRGQMRKYKHKCNCGDSDCHLKHGHGHNHNTTEEPEKPRPPDNDTKTSSNNTTSDNTANVDRDAMGFGQWETVSKQEFDAKHSNQQLIEQQSKAQNRKRWWREIENENMPVNKRKKLMGMDELVSDEERDFDDDYGVSHIMDNSEDVMQGHVDSSVVDHKIAISISSQAKSNMNGSLLDEENVMVRDAKLKLLKMKQQKLEQAEKEKHQMLERLDECMKDSMHNNGIDDALRMKQEMDKSVKNGESETGSLFKKKNKKNRKNRQCGKISAS